MNKAITALSAGAAGAGLMYVLDPGFGRRRRALLMDKGSRFSRLLGRGVSIGARDVGHRFQGLVAKGSHAFRSGSVEDSTLVERVRSELGRVAFHPSSIKVTARNGLVTLSGPVFQDEYKRLLKKVRKLSGVRFIDDRLDQREERSGEIGRGQAGSIRAGWPPATRAFAITSGLGAILFGLSRRDPPSLALAGAGAALFTRAITKRAARRLGMARERYAA
jgi:hypothetical protein